MKKFLVYIMVVALVFSLSIPVTAGPSNAVVGINVLLNTEVSDDILAELGNHGKVLDVMYEINALTIRAKAKELPEIQGLPFVEAANTDAERKGSPIDTVLVDSMAGGVSTWNLDAINVTGGPGFGTRNSEIGTGEGVYIAVLDTGLLSTWRQYFPDERIAEEFGASFGGGGADQGTVSYQPQKWSHDVNSHGTHVTSTIIGYSFYGTPIEGVAPNATIIPVKVLNQNGSGWSSVIARGINYITDLKLSGALSDWPVVINMSLGGPVLDAVEKAAIDRAIENGVIIVASAGNEGTSGMGYPGAYEPVISVAAAGWGLEWQPLTDKGLNGGWWNNLDVPEYTDGSGYYITDFSSRALAGQDLDVSAPGSWIVGAYQVNRGQIGYYFLGGTSMASPHVAGVVALMAEANPSLDASTAEQILEDTALEMPAPGSLVILNPNNPNLFEEVTWGTDATGAGLVDVAAVMEALALME